MSGGQKDTYAFFSAAFFSPAFLMERCIGRMTYLAMIQSGKTWLNQI